MTLSLSRLQSAKHRRPKRRGRGNSSGRGSYSGRGQKGQRSRSGGRNKLFRRGLKQMLQQIPKSRGFTSGRPNNQVVTLERLEKKFESGEVITRSKLLAAGLVRRTGGQIKILGNGKLTKKFNIRVAAFSKSAQAAIIKAGGKAEVVVPKKPATPVKQRKK